MDLIYFSDFHGSHAKPPRRIDEDFVKTQISKLTEILDFACDNKVEKILFGGDFFHSFSPAFFFFHEVCKVFSKYRKKNPKLFPIESCIGTASHDLEGGAESSSVFSAIFLLETLEFFSFSRRLSFGDRLFLVKLHAHQELKEVHGEKFNEDSAKIYRFRILMAHHQFLPSGNFPFPGTDTQTFETFYDLVLCSHFHHPFEVKRKNTTFLNPGCLVRRRSDETHKPSFYVISLTGKGLEYKKIELKSGKPYEEVFMSEKDVNIEKYKDFLEAFKCGLVSQDFESLLKESMEYLKLNDIEVRNKILKEFEKLSVSCKV